MGVDLRRRARTHWRLALGTAAFVLSAPASSVGLPLAALQLAARPRGRAQAIVGLLLGVVSVALLVTARGDLAGAAARSYVVLAAGSFVALALLAPARFLVQAVRASALTLGTAFVLARLVLGPEAGAMLRWDAIRQASEPLRALIAIWPQAYVAVEPTVRFVGETAPALLVLQAVAGLALAWEWHQRLALHPLGAPLAPWRVPGLAPPGITDTWLEYRRRLAGRQNA